MRWCGDEVREFGAARIGRGKRFQGCVFFDPGVVGVFVPEVGGCVFMWGEGVAETGWRGGNCGGRVGGDFGGLFAGIGGGITTCE